MDLLSLHQRGHQQDNAHTLAVRARTKLSVPFKDKEVPKQSCYPRLTNPSAPWYTDCMLWEEVLVCQLLGTALAKVYFQARGGLTASSEWLR